MSDLPYQSLYRRYRPQRFGEVRGQDHVTTALRNAVRHDRVGHAYLFSGPRGTGKTSTARILAKALNCTNLQDGEPCGVCESCVAVQSGSSLDVVELDAASNNGVDAMRDLVARAALGSPGRRKVYIVDEVHMLSPAASNALLKTLEEPPAHVVFVLATTDPQKVLPTIRSRTQPFEFHLLAPELLSSLLADVNDRADLGLDPVTLDRVARRGNGSARDALSALDQAAAAGGLEDETDVVPAIVDALADRDVAAALAAVAEAAQRGRDPRRVAEEVIAHLRSAFLVTMAPAVAGVPEEDHKVLEDQAQRLGAAANVRAMEVLGEALVDMREALDTRVTLEVALIRLCAAPADTSPAAIVQRLEALERALATAPREGGAPPEAPSGAALRAPTPPPLPDRQPGPAGAPSRQSAPEPPAAGGRPTIGAVRQRSSPGGGGPATRPARPSEPEAGPPAGPPDVEARPPQASAERPSSALPAIDAGADPIVISVPVVDRDELTRVWGDNIFPTLSTGVRSVYRTGRWLSVDSGEAVFAFEHPQFLQRGDERRGEVETALASHFGSPVGLRLVLAGAGATQPAVVDLTLPAVVDVTQPAVAGASRPAPCPAVAIEPPPFEGPLPDRPPEDDEEMTAFEFAQLEVAPGEPSSMEARLFQAFPGTEEVDR